MEEQADAVADFVEELLVKMDIDAIAEPIPHEGRHVRRHPGRPEDDMALLIGRHGQTLDAIQELDAQVVGRRLDQRIRVIVDVEDYRKRREAASWSRPARPPSGAARRGQEQELEPMDAFERKIVHDAVGRDRRRRERVPG